MGRSLKIMIFDIPIKNKNSQIISHLSQTHGNPTISRFVT